MRSFNRGHKSIWEQKPVLILLGLLVLIFAWSIARFTFKMAETKKNRELVADRVAGLTEQKTELMADIETLKTDRGKEEFFRENFGLAKEGEEVVVIVDPKPAASGEKKSKWQSFWSGLTDWFR